MPCRETDPPARNCTFIFLLLLLILFRFYLSIFREGKKGRETSVCGCLSRGPHWGPGLQPRHGPGLGIELGTLWFAACAQSTEPHQPGLKLYVQVWPGAAQITTACPSGLRCEWLSRTQHVARIPFQIHLLLGGGFRIWKSVLALLHCGKWSIFPLQCTRKNQ